MLDKNKELQEKINKFLKRLQSSFEIEKLSKKLEKFYE
jgi:ABC-type amino acid transport substrate-binding protein